MDTFSIKKPDDWHVHLRQGSMLATTLKHASEHFGRIMAMPNTKPPLVKVENVVDYSRQIAQYQHSVQVYYTLYLTDNTHPEDIEAAHSQGQILAVKWYPAGATTNSDYGVTNIEHCYSVLEKMEQLGMVLSVHGEVTDEAVDIFHREKIFIDKFLTPLRQRFPRLYIVLEHISTAYAAAYVSSANSDYLAATITAHHISIQRNHLLVGGIKPHLYCLPIVKKEADRLALLEAATSGKKCFFLGTDSAPHEQSTKESSCGCAGCYMGNFALSLYATAFDSIDKLEYLENFASVYGAQFYRLNPSETTIQLQKKEQLIPQSYSYERKQIVPFFAGKSLPWSVVS